MRRSATTLLVLVTLSLLGLQASGLHVHVNESGFHGAPTGHHVHHHVHDGSDGHVHEGDTDIWLSQPGTVAAKLLLGLVPTTDIVFLHMPVCTGVVAPSQLPPLVDCRIRWRPPLRAPPSARLIG